MLLELEAETVILRQLKLENFARNSDEVFLSSACGRGVQGALNIASLVTALGFGSHLRAF